MNKTPTSILEATKRWQARNPEKVIARRKKYIESGQAKEYYNKNRKLLLERGAGYVEQMRLKAIQIYGPNCLCGVSDPDCLAVDHIKNDGYKTKTRAYGYWKRLVDENDTQRYQVLCHNCNWKKHLTNLRSKKYGERKQKK